MPDFPERAKTAQQPADVAQASDDAAGAGAMHEVDARSVRLQQLWGKDSSPADILHTLSEANTKVTESEAARRQNARTQRYKMQQALRAAPSSEDVQTACAYFLLDVIFRMPETTKVARDWVVTELANAGFSAAESVKVIDRLGASVADRKLRWRQRVRIQQTQKLTKI